MDVRDALKARTSVRAFLSKDVPREVLVRVFSDAQAAPSWCNIQPWRVAITSGESTRELTRRLTAAAETGTPTTDFDWPGAYPEPYGQHRRECGKALYEAMGVARNDHAARQSAWMRNFLAFDAPHVAIVGMDKRLGLYPAIDVGCWLQSVLLLATSEGLGTCAQASLASYAPAIRDMLGFDENIGLLVGIAIGYTDPAAAANACTTARASLDANVTFL